MDSDTALNSIAAEVRQLEQAMENNRSVLQRTGRTAVFITLTLCLTICTFLLVNYFTLSTTWAKENFARSIEKELVEFSPSLIKQVNLLARDLLPIYSQEGRRQLMRLGPQIAERAELQLTLLNEELLQSIHKQLQESRLRVVKDAEKQIYECYPSLAKSGSREDLTNRFRNVTENALINALASFEGRFARDVDDVRDSILKMDVSDTNETTEELQKKFIHLWLQVLDREIMEL